MAPKRAFGGVLRPFGGGFRGPNRERASVFSSAGRGAERGSSAVQEGRGRGGLRCGTGGPTCSAVEPGGGASVFSGAGRGRCRGVQRCRRDGPAAGSQKKCSEGKMRPPPGRKKSVPRGRCAAARTHTGTKKTDLGPFTSISATLLCYSTGFCSGILTRCPPSHNNGPALREPVSFAGDFRQHVLLQQPVCLRFRSARRSGSQP